MTHDDGLRELTTPIAGAPLRARAGGPADGDRAPVVLVHGFGMSGDYLLPTARQLARGRAVWVPDAVRAAGAADGRDGRKDGAPADTRASRQTGKQVRSARRTRRRFARRQWARRWLSLRYVVALLLVLALLGTSVYLVFFSTNIHINLVKASFTCASRLGRWSQGATNPIRPSTPRPHEP